MAPDEDVRCSLESQGHCWPGSLQAKQIGDTPLSVDYQAKARWEEDSWEDITATPTISRSTNEAEYMSASEAARDAVWLRYLFQDILPSSDDQFAPFILHIDNSGIQTTTR